MSTIVGICDSGAKRNTFRCEPEDHPGPKANAFPMGEAGLRSALSAVLVSSLSCSKNSREHRRKCFRDIGDGSQGWALRAAL
jgi:hypothetical protein